MKQTPTHVLRGNRRRLLAQIEQAEQAYRLADAARLQVWVDGIEAELAAREAGVKEEGAHVVRR